MQCWLDPSQFLLERYSDHHQPNAEIGVSSLQQESWCTSFTSCAKLFTACRRTLGVSSCTGWPNLWQTPSWLSPRRGLDFWRPSAQLWQLCGHQHYPFDEHLVLNTDVLEYLEPAKGAHEKRRHPHNGCFSHPYISNLRRPTMTAHVQELLPRVAVLCYRLVSEPTRRERGARNPAGSEWRWTSIVVVKSTGIAFPFDISLLINSRMQNNRVVPAAVSPGCSYT